MSNRCPATTCPLRRGGLFSRQYWALVPLALGAVLVLLLALVATDRDTWVAWSGCIALPLWPVFSDLAVTLQHMHEADAGEDPLADPSSTFAYPRAVLALRNLGLHHVPLEWLGLLQAAAVIVGIVLVLHPTTPKRALATSLLLFTPPLRLGFERGNLDFALFLLCAAGAWAWSRARTVPGLVWPVAAITTGALLKLHPLFAMMGAAAAEAGKRRIAWLFGVALVVGYWCLDRAELGSIAQKIPVHTTASWGSLVVFARLERFLARDPAEYIWLASLKWPLVAVATYAVAALAACLTGLRLSHRFASVTCAPIEWCCYWVGASICCGSFVASNFSYRWIFLLLTIPLLLRQMHARERTVALWSRGTLVALAVSVMAPLHADSGIFLLTQFANWACILLLFVGGAALSRPPAPVRI